MGCEKVIDMDANQQLWPGTVRLPLEAYKLVSRVALG